jgi:hypothetical protein
MSISITSTAEWLRCIRSSSSAERHAALTKLVRLLCGDLSHRLPPPISLAGRPAIPAAPPPVTSSPAPAVKQHSWRQALPRGKTAALPSTDADARDPYSRDELERMDARFHHALEHAIACGKEQPPCSIS